MASLPGEDRRQGREGAALPGFQLLAVARSDAREDVARRLTTVPACPAVRVAPRAPACRRGDRTGQNDRRHRGRRIGVCGRCLAQDERPYLRRLWLIGWVGVCPQHRTRLFGECPTCHCPIWVRDLSARTTVDLLACPRCGGTFVGARGQDAHDRAATFRVESLRRSASCGQPALKGWSTAEAAVKSVTMRWLRSCAG